MIPQANPKTGYTAHKDEIDAAVQRVLNSGWYILGEEGRTFEQEFGAYLGVKGAAGVANGTDALILALEACGVQRNSGVLVPSHTAVATVAAVDLCGAIPIYVDIDPVTYTIDPQSLVAALRRFEDDIDIKAVIAVHLYGHPADVLTIKDICEDEHLKLIEDCAQSHGAAVKGQRTGIFGDVATFSFYPTKNLGAIGDGGMVAACEEDYAEAVRLRRQYGWRQKYISDIPGRNSRLDELQAAVLRVKLQHLDADNARRRAVAGEYAQGLKDTRLQLPQTLPGMQHVFHQYVVRTPERDALRAFLQEREIGTAVHYPQAVHQQPAYQRRAVGADHLPVTEAVVSEILSLPMYPELGSESIAQVIEAICDWDAR